jgi:ABC-type sugar transport system permease subunit
MPKAKTETAATVYAAQALEFQFDATIAEYVDLRATARARDEYRERLLNYIFVLVGVFVAALPTLLANRMHFGILIFSTVVSGIALLHTYNSRLNTYFILYEHDVLRPRLQTIIKDAARKGGLRLEPNVLQWQEFYRELTMKKWRVDGYSNVLAFGLSGLLPILAAVGGIFAFLAYRPLPGLEVYEAVMFWIAVVFAAAVILFSILTAVSGALMWATVTRR